MADKNTKKLTPFEQQQREIAKQVLEYKLGSEASIVAMIYKNPDLLRESGLALKEFHDNCWRVYFEIARAIIIDEQKVSLSDIDVGLYLDKHSKLAEKYDEYGGYNTVEDAGAYVDEVNFDGYLRDLRKWNAVIKLIKTGFPCDKERLSEFADMSAEDLYGEYTVYLNDIFANVDNDIKSYNGFEGMRELVDELDAGKNVGIPFANSDILNIETGGMLGGNIIGIGASSGCVDCDTEFFTGTGWKRISDYEEGDMVLQYNEDGTANLVKPLAYIKQPAEYLWHFKTPRGLDQCLSDDHICCYIDENGNLKDEYFKNIREKQELSGFTGKFILSFDYSGKGIDLTDDEIRLMVATFADATFSEKYKNRHDKKWFKRARFHVKKDRKKSRLIELAECAGVDYEIKNSTAEGYSDIYIDVPFRAKHYPEEWYNCNKHQLEVIADEVMFWDGNHKKKNEYCTTNKNDADFIQFVYTSLGYRGYIATTNRIGKQSRCNEKIYERKSIEYKVLVSNRTLVGMNVDKRNPEAYTKINKYKTYDGCEYCFKVPSQMLVLRRNNRIFVTHNCGKTTLVINKVLPSMVKYGLRSLFIINEQDESHVKKEILCWYTNNVLKVEVPKHILRDGGFSSEVKAALYKASEWFESEKEKRNITIIPLERYTAKTVVKLIKKYSHMCDVIVLDTLKESADARGKETWKSMMTDCVDFYDCIKHTKTAMIITYQLVKNKNKFLTNADIGVSKGIIDVFSINLFFRRPLPSEYEDEKEELYCYKTVGGKTKVQFKLERDEHYMICFVSKNRFGNSGIQIVSKADFSVNEYEDLGYCFVEMDY